MKTERTERTEHDKPSSGAASAAVASTSTGVRPVGAAGDGRAAERPDPEPQPHGYPAGPYCVCADASLEQRTTEGWRLIEERQDGRYLLWLPPSKRQPAQGKPA